MSQQQQDELAAKIAAHLAELVKDDWLLYAGTELHGDITIILTHAVRAYFEGQSWTSICSSSSP